MSTTVVVGTIHLGGTFEETAADEDEIMGWRMPTRPFGLVGQQDLAGPSRLVSNTQPVCAHAHVPHGYRGDATDPVIGRIERFAPGFREHVVRRHVRSVTQVERCNPKGAGGDISAGANTMRRMPVWPCLAPDPDTAGIPGVHPRSSATPPCTGVHGMCGYDAVGSVPAHLEVR
ncbi:hypothetical protein EOT10_19505 [Streptomyces antnestii]|uniref:Uncharacterized protein n=1 Tax=Streptomyces antnestii TaxID=2494256 RepID=A0A3S3UFQ7_9ACTN|nr:hypothetical protein [Streptomyces sp. San01]RVU23211.1 hypothetical protein EOT10_19505 [Streptomyces sp. San01]